MPQISEAAWIDCRSELAREKYQPVTLLNLTHRVRQQAGSYRYEYAAGFLMPQIPGAAWVCCRSALAREKYLPVTSPNLTLRVGQQAGSYSFAWAAGFVTPQVPYAAGSLRRRLLTPQVSLCRRFLKRPGPVVGARLPAKNISRDTAQPDPPRSPATRPQQIRSVRTICA
jgi:hypothetical protein